MLTPEQIEADDRRMAEAKLKSQKLTYQRGREAILDDLVKGWRGLSQADLVETLRRIAHSGGPDAKIAFLVEQDTLRRDITIAELDAALEGDPA